MATESAVNSGMSKRDGDVALGAEVVDLVRPDAVDERGQAGGIGEVAIVEGERESGFVRVVVEVVDAAGVEGAGAADDAVDVVALRQEELGEVGAILPGDAGDERCFGH